MSYYELTMIKFEWYWCKDRHKGQHNRREI